MKHAFAGVVKVILLAALLAVTMLLAWAFESRSMPALQLWHTAFLESEFTAADATADYADYGVGPTQQIELRRVCSRTAVL